MATRILTSTNTRPHTKRIAVDVLTPIDEAAYERYVRNHPDGLVYYSLRYKRLIQSVMPNVTPHYLIAKRNGCICGVMPMMKQSGPYGVVINALPYYGSHGAPLADDAATLQTLLHAYAVQVMQPDVAAATLVENPLAPLMTQPFAVHATDERIGQFTTLPVTEDRAAAAETLMAAFHYKTRNMIRKAQKRGVTVRAEPNGWAFLKKVHQENMDAMGGLAKSAAFFERIKLLFPDEHKLYVARIDGEPVAALLLLYYKGVVEYFTPAIRAEHRSDQPLSLLIFEAMLDAATSGHHAWNWGGTWKSQTSLHRFKKRWGTTDYPYRYFVTIQNADLTNRTREDFSTNYPNSYVLPFRLLQTQ